MRGGVPVLNRATSRPACSSCSARCVADDLAGASAGDRGRRADVNAAAQKRAGRDDDRARGEAATLERLDAGDTAAVEHQASDGALDRPQRWMVPRAGSGRRADRGRDRTGRAAPRPRVPCCDSACGTAMAARSVARAMMPPSASTSRTTVPLATPPMAGLHDIWPMVSSALVTSPSARRVGPRRRPPPCRRARRRRRVRRTQPRMRRTPADMPDKIASLEPTRTAACGGSGAKPLR